MLIFTSAVRAIALTLALLTTGLAAQQSTPEPAAPVEWRHYHGDLRGSRYSPLAQITRDNVGDLRIAWTWKSDNFGTPPEYKNETTPLYANGLLYFTAGYRRAVVAADPGTGETLWVWRPQEGVRYQRAPRRNSGRGVSFWSDGRGDNRIIVVTPGFHLVALNAQTGEPVRGFGNEGIVDLAQGLGVPVNPEDGTIGNSSPPVITHDLIIVGPAHEQGGRPRSKKNTPGYVQAYDVRTGKQVWRFHTIPKAGEPGSETWEGDSLAYTGNTGVWAPMSVDEELGYVYLPIEAPTSDWYGGHRLGDNLFGTSLVALDVKTGRKVWHYQLIRHDIYDWDNPTAPILMDLTVDGKPVKAVVQLTKQAFAYAFDRVSGTPIWPFEDRPVPASDVPGERASKTQPYPTRPKAFDLQGVTRDDLVDFTPAIKAAAEKAVAGYRLGPLFVPASLADAPDGTKGTIQVPGANGGALWEHGAVDPETGFLYVGSMTRPSLLALAKDPKHDIDFINLGGPVPTAFDLPIIKPPYGRITAIDMNRGEHVWQIPNGDTPREIRNHPMLKGVNIGRTGSPSKAGLLATKTLLFAGEGWGGQPYFRALDKQTGEIVWETRIPGVQTGTPMTYLHQGKQYVVFSAGDQDTGTPGMLVAFALADKPETTDVAARLTPAPTTAGVGPGTGWTTTGAASWHEENGGIFATAKGGASYLRSLATYANVEVTGEFFADAGVNSGIFVRCPVGDTPAISQRTCYEMNIADTHATYPTGSIVEVAAAPRVTTAGQWTSFEFHVDGSHLVARVNGKVTVDAHDDKLQGPGTIALQSSGSGTIKFRNLRIRAIGNTKPTSH